MSDSSISWIIIKMMYLCHCWSHPPTPKSLPLETASQQSFKTCLSFRSLHWGLVQACSLDTAGVFCRKELVCRCFAWVTGKQLPRVGANWGIGTARAVTPNSWFCAKDGTNLILGTASLITWHMAAGALSKVVGWTTLRYGWGCVIWPCCGPLQSNGSLYIWAATGHSPAGALTCQPSRGLLQPSSRQSNSLPWLTH